MYINFGVPQPNLIRLSSFLETSLILKIYCALLLKYYFKEKIFHFLSSLIISDFKFRKKTHKLRDITLAWWFRIHWAKQMYIKLSIDTYIRFDTVQGPHRIVKILLKIERSFCMPQWMDATKTSADIAQEKPNSWTYNFVEIFGHNLSLKVFVYNVYITNQFQTTFARGGGGGVL